jgi:phosphoribosylanthranilate isomerase
MSRIKICGLKREEDIMFLNIAKPDYAGFVFAGSKRKIDLNTAAKFRALLDDNIFSIGIFVNDNEKNIISLCKNEIINLVQLHGDEDEYYISKLRDKIKQPIIKVVRISNISCIYKEDETFKIIDTKADFVLFDTYDDSQYGGTGKVFDWEVLNGYKNPFFIAGGLNKDNIVEVIRKLNPYCVDLSSSVETDGVKDFNKIFEIVKIVRGCKN